VIQMNAKVYQRKRHTIKHGLYHNIETLVLLDSMPNIQQRNKSNKKLLNIERVKHKIRQQYVL